MELGMIGLGRMGTNMVRRLMRAGHQCVVYDIHSDAVQSLVKEGATGTNTLGDFVKKLKTSRAVWLMVPAGVVDATLKSLTPLLEPGDVVIDGGNSYYHDDIRRAAGQLKTKGIHYVDAGDQWRSLGRRTWLLPDDRRRKRMWFQSIDPIFCRLGSKREFSTAHARSGKNRRHRRARLSALRPQRRRPLCEDGAQWN